MSISRQLLRKFRSYLEDEMTRDNSRDRKSSRAVTSYRSSMVPFAFLSSVPADSPVGAGFNGVVLLEETEGDVSRLLTSRHYSPLGFLKPV